MMVWPLTFRADDGTDLPVLPCSECGESTPVSKYTTDGGRLRCSGCRVLEAHRERGCTHLLTEWCPLNGPDPFAGLCPECETWKDGGSCPPEHWAAFTIEVKEET